MAEKTRAELIAEMKSQGPSRVAGANTASGPGLDALAALRTGVGDNGRWQYAVVNVGMFSSSGRMAQALATAGEYGWELVTVYDKASNWMSGMEKGFMLFKRHVPDGVHPSQWCVAVRG